jgi:flagellar hook-length control protein FliK
LQSKNILLAKPRGVDVTTADPGDNILTGTSIKSGAAALQEKTSVEQVLPAEAKSTALSPMTSAESAVKPITVQTAVDVQPQTVAQLPAAVALNASNRGSRTDSKAAVGQLSSEFASTEVVAKGSLIMPAGLARVQANVTDVPVEMSEQLTGNLMTSAGVTAAAEKLAKQVISPVDTAGQALPDMVPAEEIVGAAASNNLIKQGNQLVASGGQVVEPMMQSDTNAASEAPSNMFQALPSGIITAPVVQRSELPANLLTSAPYTVPLMSPEADDALAGNVRWMVADGVKNAVVTVTPSGMGPISVQIDIENEQMSVSIIATQGSTREALDAMLPRLREQLGAQGLDSVRVDVSDARSDGSRSNTTGQQFGQARGEFSGNGHNNNGSSNESDQRSGDRPANETERQRVSDMQNAALGFTSGELHGQSLYDAYV